MVGFTPKEKIRESEDIFSVNVTILTTKYEMVVSDRHTRFRMRRPWDFQYDTTTPNYPLLSIFTESVEKKKWSQKVTNSVERSMIQHLADNEKIEYNGKIYTLISLVSRYEDERKTLEIRVLEEGTAPVTEYAIALDRVETMNDRVSSIVRELDEEKDQLAKQCTRFVTHISEQRQTIEWKDELLAKWRFSAIVALILFLMVTARMFLS